MSEQRAKSVRQLVLVEDDLLLSKLLANTLQEHDFNVTICNGFTAAIQTLKQVDVDVLVSDIDMGPGPTGLDLAAKLAQTHPYVPVILISNYEVSPVTNTNSLKNVTFLRKREIVEPKFLIDVIESLLGDSKLTLPHSLVREDSPLSDLTDSQFQILKLISEGLSNQDISQQRGTSLRATELLISRIYLALKIDSHSQANSRVLATRIYISSIGLNH
jgi:DNA-binding NarL/FixJ family response regulator